VEVHYNEGVAIHIGPEPCAGIREGVGEASVGILEQGKWLRQVVTGCFGYHAVPTNELVLGIFRHRVTRLWVRSLRRRSQKDCFAWRRAEKLADDWLPKPRILPFSNRRHQL